MKSAAKENFLVQMSVTLTESLTELETKHKKIKIVDKGTSKTINICAKCLRSNKVTRAV